MDPALFGARPAPTSTDPIPIWPDMADAFALFCDAEWTWVSLGMAGSVRTNIKRSELEASARLLGIAPAPATFADVRTMEDEALKYWNRKHRR